MNRQKFLFVLLCCFFILPMSVSAKDNIINASIEYTVGPTEKTYDAIEPARKKAMAVAFTKSRICVDNFVKSNNLQHTSDEITDMTSKLFNISDSGYAVPYPKEDGTIIFNSFVNVCITDADMWAYEGEFAVKRKDYDYAIKYFTKAIESYPYNSNYYNNRGIAYQYKGENILALADYDKTIALNRDKNASIDAAKNKALLLAQLEQSK